MTRVANYVVAYEATERGKDAVALGVALARLTAAELRIVLVLPFEVGQPAKAQPGASTYFSLLQAQGEGVAGRRTRSRARGGDGDGSHRVGRFDVGGA